MAVLFLAIVEHRHGTDVFYAWSSDVLTDRLYEYVKEWWHELFDDEEENPIPEDKQTAIDDYFNDNGSECYTWREIEMKDVPTASDSSELKKVVKELADLCEALIQDRGRRLFDCQVDVVKATDRISEARRLITKKKKEGEKREDHQKGAEGDHAPVSDAVGGV